MPLYQSLIFAVIELCDEFGMEWHWLEDGKGIQVDLNSTDEFSKRRFLKEAKKLQKFLFEVE